MERAVQLQAAQGAKALAKAPWSRVPARSPFIFQVLFDHCFGILCVAWSFRCAVS